MNRHRPVVTVIFLCLALCGLFVITRSLENEYWDFRNNVWAVTVLVLAGQSPADANSLARLGDQIAQPLAQGVWGPAIVLLAAPLGALDWRSAAALWMLLNIASLWGIVYLATARFDCRPARLVRLVLLCMIFPPTLEHLELGQVSLLLGTVLLLALGALARGRSGLAGGLLTLILIKPQFLVLLFPLMAYWSWRHGTARKFTVGFGVAALAQLAALTLLWPGWLSDYRTVLLRNPQWDQPNLLGWLDGFLPGGLAWALWGIATMLALGLILWLTRRSLWVAGLWALALTPLLAPYAWSWDFVLVLPLVLYTLSRANAPRFVTLAGFIAVCLLQIGAHFLIPAGDSGTFWVMPVLLGLCAWAWWQTSRHAVAV